MKVVTAHRHQFSLTGELYADLAISEGDAAQLLNMVSEKFDTSFVGMDFHSYFPDEPSALWHQRWNRLSRRRPGFKSFTFGHLVMVVEQGHWSEPVVPT